MRQQYRIRPEVIDRARERMGCSSDEQLAQKTGLTLATISRARRGAGASLGTAVALLNAARVDMNAGLAPAA